MKCIIIFGLIYMLILPLLAIGCDKRAETSMPAISGGKEATVIDLTLDILAQHKDAAYNIELIKPASLIIRLGSNPSTGYQWGEAEISDASVINQVDRNFVTPTATGVVGAPGTDVWVFDSLKAGSAVIKLSYNRPWEGEEKTEYPYHKRAG